MRIIYSTHESSSDLKQKQQNASTDSTLNTPDILSSYEDTDNRSKAISEHSLMF